MLNTVVVSIWLLWMSVLDIKSRRIPLWLIGFGGVLTLLISFMENISEAVGVENWGNYVGTLICGIIPGICLLVLALATRTVGFGDGVVLALLGGVLGFWKSILLLCIGLFLTALCSIVLLAMRKARRNTCLPFLPFLTAGWFLLV